jgi:hypothetical protein
MREFSITVIPRDLDGKALENDSRVVSFYSILKLNEEYMNDKEIIEREIHRIAENYQKLNQSLMYDIEVRTLDKISGTYQEVYSFNTKYNRFIKHN